MNSYDQSIKICSSPKMTVKLVIKVVVIFSLINSIQCVCKGSQAILDVINELESGFLNAIDELSERFKAVETHKLVNSTCDLECRTPQRTMTNITTGNCVLLQNLYKLFYI